MAARADSRHARRPAQGSLLRKPIWELPAYKHLIRTWLERFSPMGRRLFVGTIALGVLAIDPRRNQTFLLFAASFGIFVAAMVLARVARPRARLHLSIPDRATAGEPVRLRGRVDVEHGTGTLLRVAFGQRFDERLSIEPDEALVSAESGRVASLDFTLRPHKRGRYELGAVTLRALDPLGLVTAHSLDVAAGSVILVSPPLFEWTRLAGVVGRRLSPGGIPFASHTCDSLELVGTREYRPGDRLRNVHWRSFAKRGVPIVKEFQEEFFPRIAIVVDTHVPAAPTPAELEAFEAALSVAGSVAAALARADHVVELLAAGPELYRVAAGRGLGQLDHVLDVLACLSPSADAPLSAVAPAVESEIAQIGSVVAVLLDWDDGRRAFLDRLRAGADVHVVVVREGTTTVPFTPSDDFEAMTPSAVRAATRAR